MLIAIHKEISFILRRCLKYLKIPKHFITKSPSPDILPGLTDEEAMGITYDKLDKILCLIEQGKNNEEIADQLTISLKTVSHVERLIQKSEHMRKLYC